MGRSKLNRPKPGASHSIRAMTIADHGDVHRLWRNTAGICVVAEDSRERIALYLSRNRGLCFVATVEGRIVGTILCGHDGRRGVLRHLAVRPAFRNRGIGRALSERCRRALCRQGIRKCNLYVMKDNPAGMRFWERLGYRLLDDDYRTLQSATSG
jgi:ribosomal protein S18 acetylase RimI-like enzyme